MYTFGNIGALLTTAGLWAFVLIYLRRPWRETPAGRALMYRSMAFTVAMTLWSLNVWVSHYPLRFEVRAVVFWALAITTWRLVWVLIRSRDREL